MTELRQHAVAVSHTSATQDWSQTCTTTPRPRFDSDTACSRTALLSLLLWAEVPSWPCTRRSKRVRKAPSWGAVPPRRQRAPVLSLGQPPSHIGGSANGLRGSPGADRGGANR